MISIPSFISNTITKKNKKSTKKDITKNKATQSNENRFTHDALQQGRSTQTPAIDNDYTKCIYKENVAGSLNDGLPSRATDKKSQRIERYSPHNKATQSNGMDKFSFLPTATQTKADLVELPTGSDLDPANTSVNEEDWEYQQVKYDEPPANFKIIFTSSDQTKFKNKYDNNADDDNVGDKQAQQARQINPVKKISSQQNCHFHEKSNSQGKENDRDMKLLRSKADLLSTIAKSNNLGDQGVRDMVQCSPMKNLDDDSTHNEDYEIVRNHALQFDHISKPYHDLKHAQSHKGKFSRQTTLVRESNIKK